MLALLQFACFHSDVLLKHGHPPAPLEKRNKSIIVSSPKVKEYNEFLFFEKSGLQF